jgi:hypothetical protein
MGWQAIPRQGYLIEYSDSGRHAFCGKNGIPGAVCPNCRKPLLRLISLDLADPALEPIGHEGHLPLLYCWTCNIAQTDFHYQCRNDGTIVILHSGYGGSTSTFPYPNYPDYFPGRNAYLRALSCDTEKLFAFLNCDKCVGAQQDDRNANGDVVMTGAVQHSLAELNAAELTPPKHQVGGQPRLMDSYRVMRCVRCNQRMHFLASIGDDTGSGTGFTNNPFVQVLFHYCRSCRCVGAYHETD